MKNYIKRCHNIGEQTFPKTLYDIIKFPKYVDVTSIKSKYDRRYCYYCGRKLDKTKTKDHIPSRCLYEGVPTNLKSNRWTMSCCERCNTMLSKYEDDFRNYIGISNINNSKMLNVTKTAVRDLIKKGNSHKIVKSPDLHGRYRVEFKFEIIRKNAEKVLKAASLYLFNIDSWNFHIYSLEEFTAFDNHLIGNKWYKSDNEKVFKFRIKPLNKKSKKEKCPSKVKYIVGEFIYWNIITVQTIAVRIA